MPSNMEEVPRETDDAGIVASSHSTPTVSAVRPVGRGNPAEDVDMDRSMSPVDIPIRGAEAFMQQLRPITLADLPVTENGEATSCAICYEPFEESQLPDNPPVKTDCNHIFCRGCLAIWLNPEQGKLTCPTCRRELFEAEDVYDFPEVVEDVEPFVVRAPELLRALTEADAQMPAEFSFASTYPYFWRVIWTTLHDFDGRRTNVSGITYTLYNVMDMFDYVHGIRLQIAPVRPDDALYDNWSVLVLLPVLREHCDENDFTEGGAMPSVEPSPSKLDLDPRIPKFLGRRVLNRLRYLSDPDRPRSTVEFMPGRTNLPRLTYETQESVFLLIYGYAFSHGDESHCAAYWTMLFEHLTERHLALVRQADRRAARGGRDALADEDAEEDEPRLCDIDYVNWLRSFMTFVVFSGIEDIMRMPLSEVRNFNHRGWQRRRAVLT